MIVVHRLLKNEVVEKLGIPAYALIASSASTVSDIDQAALGMRAHAESYDRIGDVPAWVHDLDRRWQEEEARGAGLRQPRGVDPPRCRCPRACRAGGLGVPHHAGQRITWQPWVTSVTIKARARGDGAARLANHCMHGKDAVVEENPGLAALDYVTDRTILDTPGGPVRLLHTIEPEPGPGPLLIRRADDPPREGADGVPRAGLRGGPLIGAPGAPRGPRRRARGAREERPRPGSLIGHAPAGRPPWPGSAVGNVD